jgi:AcrR family transcriptional regulator
VPRSGFKLHQCRILTFTFIMRLRDDNKRKHITATAARLFASEPFHKVRLDDVAAAAGVGKGTLYIYFDSKEDLYFSIIYDGFAEMVDRLKGPMSDDATPARDRIRAIVREMARFAYQHPQMSELMRTAGACKESADWDEKRTEFAGIIERVLRDGVAKGEFLDTHPNLTAMYIPSLIRSATMFGPRDLREDELVEHVTATIEHGICKRAD